MGMRDFFYNDLNFLDFVRVFTFSVFFLFPVSFNTLNSQQKISSFYRSDKIKSRAVVQCVIMTYMPIIHCATATIRHADDCTNHRDG